MTVEVKKIYISPGRSEPEMIMVPAGLKDAQGNKIPRKAIKFRPNNVGVGFYETSDPREIKHIEDSGWFKAGRITEYNGDPKDVRPLGKPKVHHGPVTSEAKEPKAPEVPAEKPKGAKIGK